MPQTAVKQVLGKQQFVEGSVRRGVDLVHTSESSLGYRARLSLGRGPQGECVFRQQRSHELVPVDHCPVARPEINRVLAQLPALPPEVQSIELRSDGESVVLSLHAPARGASPDLAEFALENLEIQGLALNGGAHTGDCRTHLSVCGIDHAFSPSTFYQVNLDINERMVKRVVSITEALNPAHVLDLYAGAGNLSLSLAAKGIEVTLLEREGAALADARRTAERHQLQIQTKSLDIRKFRGGDLFFDVALLDPPRAGAPGVVEQLLVTRPRAILYVSCNPKTLARDIQPALRSGYEVFSLELFDMFPQTHHCEVFCVLHRS